MFFKLLKYDLNYSKNTFLTIIGVMIGAGLIVGLIGFIDAEFNLFGIPSEMVLVLGALLLGFGTLAISIIAVIQIVQFYNKNFFSDAGYLTLTLPVSRAKLLLSKILVSMFWFNLMALATVIFMWLAATVPGHIWNSIFDSWFGFANALVNVLVVNAVILFSYALLFFAITLGNSVILNKRIHMAFSLILAGVLFITFVYLGSLLDNALYQAQFGTIVIAQRTVSNDFFPDAIWTQQVHFPWFVLILIVAISAVFFFITHYLLKKKISLK